MAISLAEFKQAFAADAGDGGGLARRMDEVAAALNRLHQSVKSALPGDAGEGPRKAVEALANRYKLAKEQAGRPGTNAAGELDEILRQTRAVAVRLEGAPGGGRPLSTTGTAAPQPTVAPTPPARTSKVRTTPSRPKRTGVSVVPDFRVVRAQIVDWMERNVSKSQAAFLVNASNLQTMHQDASVLELYGAEILAELKAGSGGYESVVFKWDPQFTPPPARRGMTNDGFVPGTCEVFDAKSGKPIPLATIRFPSGKSYPTDAKGRYKVLVKPNKQYEVEVSAPGYEPQQEVISVGEVEWEKTTRLVAKDPAKLERVVMGITVVDAIDGKKLPKARVTVGRVSKTTDVDGFVNIEVLPGIYQYSVTVSGYQTAEGPIAVPESKQQELRDIKVWPGAKDKPLKVRTGVVVAKDFAEVRKAIVGWIGRYVTEKRADAVVEASNLKTMHTDAGVLDLYGAEILADLKSGSGGYESVAFQWDPKFEPPPVPQPDKVVMGITIVNMVDGTKVQKARVVVERVSGLSGAVERVSGITDVDGFVNIYVLPGSYSYSVTARGYHKEEGPLLVPVSKTQEFEEIKVRPTGALGEELKDWELKDGKAPLVVEVLDAQRGRPIAGATVRFEDGYADVTGTDGRLRLNVKAPNSFKIDVSAPGYQNGHDSFTMEERRGKMQTVRLAPIDASKIGKVSLRVTVSDVTDKSMVAGARVTVGRIPGVTGADGVVSLEVLPGIHDFSITAKGYVNEKGRWDVPAGKDEQQQVIGLRPEGGADIFIRVLSARSKQPIPGAAVRVSSQQESTDSHGEARFLNMPFGEHGLGVQADGYKPHRITIKHARDATAGFTEVELDPN